MKHLVQDFWHMVKCSNINKPQEGIMLFLLIESTFKYCLDLLLMCSLLFPLYLPLPLKASSFSCTLCSFFCASQLPLNHFFKRQRRNNFQERRIICSVSSSTQPAHFQQMDHIYPLLSTLGWHFSVIQKKRSPLLRLLNKHGLLLAQGESNS